MKVDVKGIKEIEQYLDKKFSKKQMQRITDASLTVAGNKVVELLKKRMTVFEDTGRLTFSRRSDGYSCGNP